MFDYETFKTGIHEKEGDNEMQQVYTFRRVNNPSGHQVCRVNGETRTVAIQNKRYMTLIRFREDGGYDIRHQKVEKPEIPKAAGN